MVARAGSGRLRASRRVAGFNSAVAVGVVIALAAISLLANPSAPPSIAEFSPRAQQPIENAPEEQSAASGGVAAGAGDILLEVIDDGGPTLPAGATDTDDRGVPSALSCVSWPDGSVTQTFDPQSPPCIATWSVEGGNGGATARGVTRTEILVAVPETVNGLLPPEYDEAIVDFINSHYQLYGRQMRLVHISRDESPEGQAASAREAADLGVFAAVGYDATAPSTDVYLRRLAEHGILAATGASGLYTSSNLLTRLSPYLWAYYPPLDSIVEDLGAVACKSLVGRNARFAGPSVQTSTRSFAVLYDQDARAQAPPTAPLVDRLTACGAPVRVVELPDDDSARAAEFVDLRTSGVTSLVCVAFVGTCTQWMLEVGAVRYDPEWVLVGIGAQISAASWAVSGADQRAHLFGVVPWNKELDPSSEPVMRVYAEAGLERPVDSHGLARDRYHELTILAAGIQLAGSHLTTESFAAGLQRTRFPNPGAGQMPYWQASVGFGPGDHVMVDDFSVVWWNEAETSPYSALQGAFCWLHHGTRWTSERWPAGEPNLFSGDCR